MSRTDKFFRDKVVLITGASSGIGEELARQLGRAGARLTLAARRTELLQALVQEIAAAAPGGAAPARSNEVTKPLAVACDVTRAGDLERPVAESVRHWGRLDGAIADAAF